jgi:hypothetical protein
MDEMEAWQPKSLLPGMWPTTADETSMNKSSVLKSTFPTMETFTLGSLADSAYEYLPKVRNSYNVSKHILTPSAIHDAWRSTQTVPNNVRIFR